MIRKRSRNRVARKDAKECQCLTCARPIRDEYEGLKMLICGEEACFLKCNTCTERPRKKCAVPISENEMAV